MLLEFLLLHFDFIHIFGDVHVFHARIKRSDLKFVKRIGRGWETSYNLVCTCVEFLIFGKRKNKNYLELILIKWN